MKFIFRPTVDYASYLKKFCQRLALSLKSNGVINRVHDGFLVRVRRDGNTSVADVIDLRGVLYVSVDIQASGLRWIAGHSLGTTQNPTELLFRQEVEPELAVPLYVLPGKYTAAQAGAVWESGRPAGLAMGLGATVHETGIYSARLTGNEFQHITVLRVSPSSPFQEGGENFNWWTLPEGDQVLRGVSVKLFDIPTELVGDPLRITYYEVVPADSSSGFIVFSVIEEDPEVSNQVEQLRIIRYALADAQEDETRASVSAYLFAEFGLEDIPEDDKPEERPERFWGLGSDFQYRLISIDGPHDPSAVKFAPIFNGIGAHGVLSYRARLPIVVQITTFIFTGSYFERTDAGFRPVPMSVACRGGMTMLLSVGSGLETAAMPATFEERSSGDIYHDEVFEPGAYQQTCYVLRIESTGAKSISLVEKSIFAVHDGRWSGDESVGYYPLLASVINDSAYFLCLRRATGVRYRTDIFGEISGLSGISQAIDVEDVSLRIVEESGFSREVALGSFYPVRLAVFPTFGNRISPDDSAARERYGENPQGRSDLTSCQQPACVCGPGLYAVVVAPKSGYANENQTASVAVVSALTGLMVGVSPAVLPFHVEPDEGRDHSCWNISCAEQAVLNEEGAIVRHAVLILYNARSGMDSRFYRMDDLAELVELGSAPGAGLGHGLAVYLGTPIAPAKVGVSVNRPFIG